MDEKTNIKTLSTLSIKTEPETVDRFNRLKEELNIMTSGQLLTEMLDRIEQPQRIADRTKELENQITVLQQQLADSEKRSTDAASVNDQLESKIEGLQRQLEETTSKANHNAEVAEAQQMAFNKQLEDIKPKENQRVVTFTPDNLKVIELVAARESKRRKQAWSISHVINFFIFARFVKGMLNGDMEAVGDSELRKIGVSLKTKAREAVEI